MRLLTLLTFACGALALATGPVHRPADQQAVDGDAPLNLEKAVLADQEIPRHDEEASQSLEQRANGIAVDGLRFPKTATPGAMIIAGVKITFTMAFHWIKTEGGKRVFEYYVESLKVVNEVNRRLSVEMTSAGKMILNAHMNQLGETTATPPENAETFGLFISELHGEL
ncbi:hypothetical protein E4U60_007879 [Claviceps pazoutovae]|uniref:Uncharacterized protein n=1 Tax=Claviceps pazoutovae TaxID=1649127 RepID=A0A9P7SBQ1_9HYPO|nr:hypothetical protein E4U60_007879 [Claviceps pazoutovae]